VAPEDSRIFVFFEHNHVAYTRFPFVDCTLDLFLVVSSAAFVRVKTYSSDGECKPHDGERFVMFCPLNAIVALVLKEHSIDHLLDSRCHVYTSMFIENVAAVLLALVSMDSGKLSTTYSEYECRVPFQFHEQCSIMLNCIVICAGIKSIHSRNDSMGL
jgi:hypothetical protein